MKEVLNQEDVVIGYKPGSGKYSMEKGPFKLVSCKPVVRLNGKKTDLGEWKIVKQTKTSIQAKSDGETGIWSLKLSLTRASDLVLEFSGKLKESCARIEALYFEGIPLRVDHVLQHGITMGGAESYPAKDAGETPFESYLQTLFTREGETMRLSFPLKCEHIPKVKGIIKNGKAKIAAGSDINHFDGKQIRLEPLTIRVGNGFQLMRDYASEAVSKPRDFSKLAVPGWNSWDYYRWTINEDEVLENAEFIAKDPVLSKHVKRIIIDDGWQYCYGEWEANHLFPHGMKSLAGKIKKLGFAPGLWIAPMLIEPHSWIAQMEYDMLAKNEAGLPTLCFDCMRRKTFLLDPTVEKSQQFVAKLFDRYAKDGYEYFKLDFLNAIHCARQFADRSVPRGKLMELIVGNIRSAINGRANILGCNYGFNGGTELVDAVRVGGDIHSVWDSVKANTASVAASFWANKRLWVNDPDFALCRGFDTSDDPDLTRLQPSLVFIEPNDTNPDHPGLFRLVDVFRPQAEVLLSLVIAAGGAVNLSDKMTRLNESGLDLARRTVSAESGEAAVPLDLFSSKLPMYWVQKIRKGHRVLLINWREESAELTMDLARAGVKGSKAVNFWNDKPVPVKNGKLSVELPPRSCLFATIQ